MLNRTEVNQILQKYSKLIDESILKVNIDYNLLHKRCITIDDVKQEVYIKLWERLENYYNSDYDLERFLSFHAIFHTKFVLSNLRRSSTCFVGSMNTVNKSGQSKIDNVKISLSDLVDYALGKEERDNFHCINKQMLEVSDLSYLVAGENLDYDYIISEIKKRLLNQDKENKNYNKIYVDVFEYIINNYNLLYDKITLQLIIAEKFNYKTRGGVRYILNRIKQVMYDVIIEYMSI